MVVVDRLLGNPRLRSTFYRLSSVPVLRIVQRRMARAVIRPGALRWVIVPEGVNEGLRMLVDPRAEVGYLRGDHEPWLQNLLEDWLPSGGTFLDVGSHAGFFAMAAARLVGPSGTVIAIEPDPATFRRLEQNRDRNALDNVELVNAAAWDAEREIVFASSIGSDSGVTGRVEERPEAAGVSIRAVTLDGVLNGRVPDAIKLDVEGAELVALRAATDVLNAVRTRWIVETHGDELRKAVLDQFREAGYRVTESKPVHPVYADYGQDYVLAEPSSVGSSANTS